ncbi:MAG: cell division protein FtsA [Dehalococcoidia bacterium]|nr:cell division protein FtsA [Dehalococcoidia bacterium]
MTQDPNVLVAVDVGTTKVCTIVARRVGDEQFHVVSFSVVPSRGLARGVVTDMPDAAEAVRACIQDAARQAALTVRTAYVGVTGSHVSFDSRSDLIGWAASKGVITRDDLDRVPFAVAKAGARPGRQIIHALPRNYTLDGQSGIKDPLGMHTRKLEVESHVVSAEVSLVQSLTGAVERSGLEVEALVLEPVASAEAVLTERERYQGVVLVDIGGGTSDLIVFDRGAIELTAILPVGGFQFTNDICVTYGTDYAAAEAAKLEHGHTDTSIFGAADEIILPVPGRVRQRRVALQELSQLMRERAVELARMIRLKMTEAGIQDPGSANVVLTGGSSQLPGIDDLFKRQLTPKLRIGGANSSLDVPEALRAPEFATSVGLLRWALRQPSGKVGVEDEPTERRNEVPERTFSSRLRKWLSPR